MKLEIRLCYTCLKIFQCLLTWMKGKLLCTEQKAILRPPCQLHLSSFPFLFFHMPSSILLCLPFLESSRLPTRPHDFPQELSMTSPFLVLYFNFCSIITSWMNELMMGPSLRSSADFKCSEFVIQWTCHSMGLSFNEFVIQWVCHSMSLSYKWVICI